MWHPWKIRMDRVWVAKDVSAKYRISWEADVFYSNQKGIEDHGRILWLHNLAQLVLMKYLRRYEKV